MKREWEINAGTVQALASIWFAFGFIAFVVAGVGWRDYDRQGHDTGVAWVHSPVHWILPLWLAPYALVASVYLAIGVRMGLGHLWHNPPVRRVVKPVTKDLREVGDD